MYQLLKCSHVDYLVAYLNMLILELREFSMEAHVYQQSQPYKLMTRFPWMEDIYSSIWEVMVACSSAVSVASKNESGSASVIWHVPVIWL